MPTIADLQIRLDSRPVEQGTQALNALGEASARVTRALDAQKRAQDALGANSGTGRGGGIGDPDTTRKVRDLSSAIDNQTRRLKALQDQRTALNNSNLNVSNPAEFQRLNQVIDANITLVNRQGNAINRLARQVEAEQTALANKAQTERNRSEAQRRSVEASERAEANRAQRQQRDLDRTLAGLSAQIKAQQEYNRTVAELDRARSPSTGANVLSAAEYDSYVQLAAAKRDEALATKDNTAEQERLRSKLESVTATLGKAERAQVQYDQSLRKINQALAAELITVDQYNEKLGHIARRRDEAVAAANNQAAAERRLESQLRSITTAFDPVLSAQKRYDEAARTLAAGLAAGKISIDQYNKALAQQSAALRDVQNAQPDSAQSQSKRYQDAIDRLIPYNAQLRNLAEAEKTLQQAQASGRVRTEQQIETHRKATEAIKREREEVERRIKASRDNTITLGQEQNALRQLPAQFTDVVVSLQGGQAPLTVLLQQGGQIKDTFGGVGAALRATGGYLAGLITPINVVAAGLLAVAAGAYAGSNEVVAFNQTLVRTNNAAGITSSEFSNLRESIDGTIGTSRKAAEALTLIASSGKIAGENFEKVALAAISFSRATGEALSDIVDDFSALGKDPVDSAVRLDEKYRFLTSSILAQAQALVAQGKEYEATSLLQTELANASQIAADKMVEQLNGVGRVIKGLKDGFSELIDEFYKLGRVSTTADILRSREKELEDLNKASTDTGAQNRLRALGFDVSDNRRQQLTTEITQLRQRIQYETLLADQQSESERKRRESVLATSNLERFRVASLDGVAAAQEKVNSVNRDAERIRAAARDQNRELTADEQKLIKASIDEANDKLKEAREKAARKGQGGNVVDTTQVQEVKSNLRVIEAEYSGAYKRIEELGKANVVSQSATSASLIGVLTQQKEAVVKSYDEQIAQIKILQGNKKNTAAQNVSLENQLTRAESQRLEAVEKINTRIEQIQIREKGFLEERKRNIAQYQDSLNQQLQSLQDTGARNAAGVGRGDRQAELSRQLDQQQRTFNRQRQRLAEANLDPEEYAEKLRILTKAHDDMTAQILSNDKAVQDARRDGFNGLTAAIENATDAGNDFAGNIERGLTGAFQKAGDALGDFVTTGKFNFSSFASSIIADLARIAAQQAAQSALGGIFSIALTAFGGGANGFAAGSAGAISSKLGASSAGYGAAYGFKSGGAFDGGQVNRFANGGAFGTLTNSVISTPTRFRFGDQLGEVGEAGPEAILPLQRAANGSLGVRAMGLGGGGVQAPVNVQVYVTGESSKSQSSDPAYTQFGDQLGQFVQRQVYGILNKETNDGGLLSKGQSR